jgi:hypothetical protein
MVKEEERGQGKAGGKVSESTSVAAVKVGAGKSRLEDYEYRETVYCKLVKTYVEISLCRAGGPMKAAGPCAYFGGIRHDKNGNAFLMHAVPTEQNVVKMIIKEKS